MHRRPTPRPALPGVFHRARRLKFQAPHAEDPGSPFFALPRSAPMRSLLLAPLLMVSLSACDVLGIEPTSATAGRKDGEARAIGSACRHAGRAIEDCYTLHPRADKSAVFGGWRDMNDYMREHSIQEVAPQIPRPVRERRAEADTDEPAARAVR
jgi:hypothetical protein